MTDNVITLPNNWKPRGYQLPVWCYLEKGGRHAEYNWPRRAGKDEVALHWTSVATQQRIGTYWYMLPMAAQARKAIWTAVNPQTGKKRIDEAFPEAMRSRTVDNAMYIEFKNGSTWQVVGSDNFNSLVGSPPIGIVYSEWPLTDPTAKAYLMPIMAENGGWQIFNGTPRGKNHAFTSINDAKDEPDDYGEILTVDDTRHIAPEVLEKMRRQYIKQYGEVLGAAFFDQEFYCSYEAPIMGAVFSKELREAQNEGRICRVPFDPSRMVHTFWDLGRADKTTVWMAQITAFEIRIIDYIEGTGKHISEYITELQAKQYKYGETWIPHDGFNNLLASKRTVAQQLLDAGFDVKAVPKTSIAERHEAARLVFPLVYFDADRTEVGRNALNNYRYAVDEQTKQLSDQPLHDWASHASDAFSYMGVAIHDKRKRHEAPVTSRQPVQTNNTNAGGRWM